ncbi:hypothetical protein TNCV_3725161 [Trichonephila clavipes]|nr:hypothetical protein TNCV_3725161 [Trichonephila clavipes]
MVLPQENQVPEEGSTLYSAYGCSVNSSCSRYHSDNTYCQKSVTSKTAPSQVPSSVYSTAPKPLPFVTRVVSRQSLLEDGANGHSYTAVVTQHALRGVDMLQWPLRSPFWSPIEPVGDIIGRQLQHPSQSALTETVLTQIQQARTSYQK